MKYGRPKTSDKVDLSVAFEGVKKCEAARLRLVATAAVSVVSIVAHPPVFAPATFVPASFGAASSLAFHGHRDEAPAARKGQPHG